MNPHTTKPPLVISRRTAVRALLAAAGAGFFLKVGAQDGPITIYFHSAETNVNNFALLKESFDGFLADHGGHKFQPIADRATFEKQLAAQPRGLFLMSSWHCQQLAAKAALDPLLVGLAKGMATQRHQLFSQAANLADLRGQTIATAATLDYTQTLLREIFPDQHAVIATLKLLPVPKDIDALMAIGFGDAKAAVATESGADKLANLNPKQRAALKIIGPGRESLRPVLAVPRAAAADVRALAKVFAGAGAANSLKLLGLDAMRELDPEQKKKLIP